MAEGLRTLHQSLYRGWYPSGPPLHNLQPTASHSQFVDDTMLMNTPTAQEAIKLNSILSDFSEASVPPLTWKNPNSFSLTLHLLSKPTSLDFWASPGAPFHPIILGFPYLMQQHKISLGTTFYSQFPIA
jgi:hypothetical protein